MCIPFAIKGALIIICATRVVYLFKKNDPNIRPNPLSGPAKLPNIFQLVRRNIRILKAVHCFSKCQLVMYVFTCIDVSV